MLVADILPSAFLLNLSRKNNLFAPCFDR